MAWPARWPPTADDFYLADDGQRPVFQGDVFSDVPFTKVKAGDRVEADPKPQFDRRYVATITHPCDMYVEGGRVLARPQGIALVRSAEQIAIPDDWGGAYSICPLPDLLGDGQMWVVDFSLVANVDRSYLRQDRRVRCLSELGWAVFRQRHALAATRLKFEDLEELRRVGAATWAEQDMESDWVRSGRQPQAFHDWLDADDAGLGGITPRKALERGRIQEVRARLMIAMVE